MFFVDRLIFYGGLLVLVAILSRKVSARFGVPVLAVFLFVGMLAGSEGIGGIAFENYQIAHGIGSVALVVILFDGGLRTRRESLRMVWKPALTLATLGVLLTAGLTGLVASRILGIPLLQGLLLASIVASTDAAAVFSILRSQGVRLNDRLSSVLEIESGSNDPMAIFLTVGLIEVLLGDRSLGVGMATFFVSQMGLGLVVGYGVGRISAWVVNRINLDAAGLYPVLVLAVGFAAFGLAAFIGGSGFLAVYVAGIVLGNSHLVFQRGTLLFHDGLAWISQIVMFIVLGLLSFPSALIDAAGAGLAVAVVLTFVARPASVFLLLWPFRYTVRELLLISWVGLKGAVPIILGTFPLLLGLPNGVLYFNVVFFVVLISALTQGWTLPVAARVLGLQLPNEVEAPLTLDITSLHRVNADIVDYQVAETSGAAHLRISELALPEDVVIAMITRGNEIIPARGAAVLLPGDHVFVILRPSTRPAVDGVFGTAPRVRDIPLRTGILLPGSMLLDEVNQLYGITLAGSPHERLDHFLQQHYPQPLEEGSFMEMDGLRLYMHAADTPTGCVIGIEEIPFQT
ncbi:MAG TPA: potassium/proton antiporter [Rhodothermales bacterium]|nr:potassium/proton antiporter [Rhodothermales bacterium]